MSKEAVKGDYFYSLWVSSIYIVHRGEDEVLGLGVEVDHVAAAQPDDVLDELEHPRAVLVNFLPMRKGGSGGRGGVTTHRAFSKAFRRALR